MNKEKSSAGRIQWGRMLKKLSPYTIQKGFRYLKHYGPKEFWIRFTKDLSRRKFLTDRGMRLMCLMKQRLRNRDTTILSTVL